jgi:hypothetical protein
MTMLSVPTSGGGLLAAWYVNGNELVADLTLCLIRAAPSSAASMRLPIRMISYLEPAGCLICLGQGGEVCLPECVCLGEACH